MLNAITNFFNSPAGIITFKGRYSFFCWPGTEGKLSRDAAGGGFPGITLLITCILTFGFLWTVPWTVITAKSLIDLASAKLRTPLAAVINYEKGEKFILAQNITYDIQSPEGKKITTTVPKGSSVNVIFKDNNGNGYYAKDAKGNFFLIDNPYKQLNLIGHEVTFDISKNGKSYFFTNAKDQKMVSIPEEDFKGKKITVTEQTTYTPERGNYSINYFAVAADGKKLGYKSDAQVYFTFPHKLPVAAKTDVLMTSEDAKDYIEGKPLEEIQKHYGYADNIAKRPDGSMLAQFSNITGDLLKNSQKREGDFVVQTDKNGIVTSFVFNGKSQYRHLYDKLPVLCNLLNSPYIRQYMRINGSKGYYVTAEEYKKGGTKADTFSASRFLKRMVPEKLTHGFIGKVIRAFLVFIEMIMLFTIVGIYMLPPLLIAFFIPFAFLMRKEKLSNFIIWFIPWLLALTVLIPTASLSMLTMSYMQASLTAGTLLVAWFIFITPEVLRELNAFRCPVCHTWDSYDFIGESSSSQKTIERRTKTYSDGHKNITETEYETTFYHYQCEVCETPKTVNMGENQTAERTVS